MSAKGFMPGLFDRLIDRPGQAQTGTVPRVSLEEMKDSVARDLEALLNTRAVMPEDAFRRFPECARSIVAYGLHDFAGDGGVHACDFAGLALDGAGENQGAVAERSRGPGGGIEGQAIAADDGVAYAGEKRVGGLGGFRYIAAHALF